MVSLPLYSVYWKIVIKIPGETKMKQNFLEAGKILNVHGIAGELKFEHWCDSADALKGVKTLYWDRDGEKALPLRSIRVHGRFLLLKAEGINDPETARLYKNRILYVRREDLKLPEGRVFICDLIGLPLIDVDTQTTVGTVKDVVNRGASDLYLLDLGGGREEYFPAVKDFLVNVDIEKGIYVHVPQGLFDKAEQ